MSVHPLIEKRSFDLLNSIRNKSFNFPENKKIVLHFYMLFEKNIDNDVKKDSPVISSVYISDKSFLESPSSSIDSEEKLLYHNRFIKNKKDDDVDDINNHFVYLVFPSKSKYLDIKLRKSIDQNISKIRPYKRGCCKVVQEEKDGIFKTYFLLKITQRNIKNKNTIPEIWLKSSSVDFEHDDLFLLDLQKHLFEIFRDKIEINDIKNNISEYIKMINLVEY